MVQEVVLKILASVPGLKEFNPSLGTKIPHTVQCSQQVKKKKFSPLKIFLKKGVLRNVLSAVANVHQG